MKEAKVLAHLDNWKDGGVINKLGKLDVYLVVRNINISAEQDNKNDCQGKGNKLCFIVYKVSFFYMYFPYKMYFMYFPFALINLVKKLLP